jgi:hypothetical protein
MLTLARQSFNVQIVSATAEVEWRFNDSSQARNCVGYGKVSKQKRLESGARPLLRPGDAVRDNQLNQRLGWTHVSSRLSVELQLLRIYL